MLYCDRRTLESPPDNTVQLDLGKRAVFAKQPIGILTSFFSKTKQAIEAASALKPKVAEFFKTKKRHTVYSRTHHFTEAGTVNHLNRLDITACSDIKSHFFSMQC